jgi:hypothetical protein
MEPGSNQTPPQAAGLTVGGARAGLRYAAGCGKTPFRRGSGDFTSPQILRFQQKYGHVKSPLHILP